MATLFLAILVFGFFSYVLYKKFIKHESSCKSCHDLGCPLIDSHKNKKHQ